MDRETQDQGDKIRHRYRLTWSNGCLFLIALILLSVSLYGRRNGDANEDARLIGELTGALFFPLLVSWLLWKFTRSRRASSWSFNVLIVMALLSNLLRDQRQQGTYREMEETYANYKDAVTQSDNLDEVIAANEEIQEDYLELISDLEERGATDEQLFASAVMKEHALLEESSNQWEKAYDAAVSSSILIHPAQIDEASCLEQVMLIKNYREETQRHMDFFNGTIERIETRLGEHAQTSAFLRSAIDAARRSFKKKADASKALFGAHIVYSGLFEKAVEVISSNPEAWVVVDDEIRFKDDRVMTQYNELVEEMHGLEVEVDRLSIELFRQ